MRSYQQFCALAKALDVVGDRWTLLIVRELTLRGPSRYTDLRGGLPGIATNLLADRLRALERAGVVVRRSAPPPVASDVFELTERGRALRPALDALGSWGIDYMVDGPQPGDEFRSQWLAWPAEMFLADSDPAAAPVAIELRAGGEPMTIHVGGGEVRAESGAPEHADVVLSGSPHAILGILSGHLALADAAERGLVLEGDEGVLARVRPQPAAASG